jgi:hypothetical protein
MESYFKQLTLWLASGSEAAAALVIGLATLEATVRALWLFAKGALAPQRTREHQDEKEQRPASTRALAGGCPRIRIGRRRAANCGRADLGRNRAIGRHSHFADALELLPPNGNRQSQGAQC